MRILKMSSDSENVMQLDEIRVGANGDIDVRVVPPDEVSTEPDFLVTCAEGTSVHGWVLRKCLEPIARELGVRSRVAGVVHGGEDTYTIWAVDDQSFEVNRQTYPHVVELIEKLAEKVGGLALRGGSEAPRRFSKRQPT
jgi:hypothetical protein